MSYSVKKNNISMTRGDTFKAQVRITNPDGSEYTPDPHDLIQFAVKKDYDDPDYIISKFIPVGTMLLELQPEDTKHLEYGDYVYDMQLTKNSSKEVSTFITKSRFTLTEEVC